MLSAVKKEWCIFLATKSFSITRNYTIYLFKVRHFLMLSNIFFFQTFGSLCTWTPHAHIYNFLLLCSGQLPRFILDRLPSRGILIMKKYHLDSSKSPWVTLIIRYRWSVVEIWNWGFRVSLSLPFALLLLLSNSFGSRSSISSLQLLVLKWYKK